MVRYDRSSSNIIALAVILGTASIVSVLLRILARARSRAHLGVDDVFAVVALCGFLAYTGIIIWGQVPRRTCLLQFGLLQLTTFAESYNGIDYEFNALPPSVLKSSLKVRSSSRNIEGSCSLIALGVLHLCCYISFSSYGRQVQFTFPL